MRIAAVARELGFSADYLRDLERIGRIPPVPRDLNGHRRFSSEDVERLRTVLLPDQDCGSNEGGTVPGMGTNRHEQVTS